MIDIREPLIHGFHEIARVMQECAGRQPYEVLNSAMNEIDDIIRKARWDAMEQLGAAQKAEIAELKGINNG
jgi:hypothetical protein